MHEKQKPRSWSLSQCNQGQRANHCAAETTLSAGLTIHAEGIETYVVGESYYQ